MVSIAGIRSIAKGVVRTFGSSAVQAPTAAKGASVFAGSLNGASQAAKTVSEVGKSASGEKTLKTFFQRYFSKFKVGLEKADVQKMESAEGPQFWEEARSILAKKNGIPDELLPKIEIYTKAPNPRQAGFFHFPSYSIGFNEEHIRGLEKSRLFSLLAHEMQHCEQSLMLLRSKNVAPEAIEYFSREYGQNITALAINNYKNLPMEFWEKTVKEKNLGDEVLELAKKIKTASESEMQELKQHMINENAAECAKGLKKLQELVVEKMGTLPENIENLAKVYFRFFKNSTESGSKGTKYWLSIVEGEAYLRQFGAYREYMKLK